MAINPIAYNTTCTQTAFKNAFVTVPSSGTLNQYYITSFTASYGNDDSPGNCSFTIYKTSSSGTETSIHTYSHNLAIRVVSGSFSAYQLQSNYSYGIKWNSGIVGGEGYTITLNLTNGGCLYPQ